MPAVVLAALSITERIKEYGAYAGFAAVIGLGVLALLYFGQARELKRLREWAGREPERAAEREARGLVAQPVVAQRPVGSAVSPAQPRPRPATAAGAGAVVAANGAPQDTQVIKPGEVPAVAASVQAAPGFAPAASAPVKPPPKPVAAPAQPVAAPQPSAIAPDVTQVGAPPAAPRPRPVTVPATAAAAQQGAPPRPPAARRYEDPYEDEEPPRRSRGRILAIVGGALATVLIVGVLVTQVLGGGDDPAPTNDVPGARTTATTGERASTTSTTTEAQPLARGDVTVAVLNGTTVTGLARQALDKLASEGYQEGSTENALDRTLQTTLVQYADGYRRAAQDVAKLIGGVPAENIKELDRSTAVVAGEEAKVVVTLGADKAQ